MAAPGKPPSKANHDASPLTAAASQTDPADPFATGACGAADVNQETLQATSTSRYKVLRPHARGGLGVISIAEDKELRREVAFKEIQPQYADEPGSRFRFLREAEITGRLEHPGIVPVYGLGMDAGALSSPSRQFGLFYKRSGGSIVSSLYPHYLKKNQARE
jgi:hypothetical protein